MVGRQARNLMREPIWIALLLIQPLVWLLLYGQLFKNVTHLGGFGTQSYITFLAPAIVVMNAFFGAHVERDGDDPGPRPRRRRALPDDAGAPLVDRASRRSSRSALTAAIQATIIIAVSLRARCPLEPGAARACSS